MKKHITDAKTEINYTLHGDYYEHASNKVPGHPSEIFDFVDGSGSYYLPDLSLPAEEEIPIGVWGERHKQFLKNNQLGVYNEFLVCGKLQTYLAQIDHDAQEMFDMLVRQLAKQEDVSEQLKAENQMEWVQKMNSIRNRATKIVNKELIFV